MTATLPRLLPRYEGFVPYPAPTGRAGTLRLDANEGPPAPLELLAPLLAASAPRCVFYPEYDALLAAAARVYGVPVDMLLAVAGADEGIRILCQAFLEPGRTLVTPWPTFSMYESYAALVGGRTVRVALGPDFRLDLPALEAAARGADLLCLASPGTPDGRLVPADEIEALLAAMPDRPLVLDETYADFAGVSLVPLLERHPNLVILKTMSKSYGVPGLRLGFVLARPGLVAALEGLRSPYNVTAVAAAVAEELFAADDQVSRRLAGAVAARVELASRCAAAGLATVPSDTHFCLIRIGDVEQATALHAHLAARGILVRSLGTTVPGYIRVSVTSLVEVDAFWRELTAFIADPAQREREIP